MWGAENARKIRQRLAELNAAATLADIGRLPPARPHALKGNRKGQFAVDVRHPFRLLFEPADDPVPLRDDGGVDLARITRIRVLSVEDYHGD
ncbi:MAG TPA: killer suppression protein [Candidatus Methylomirabilis sp.]|nr:killer suppression protein [Candidatus Methylomirabilis sp.]